MNKQPDNSVAKGIKPHANLQMGQLMALSSAAFLGVNTSLARLAYEGGSNPGTVVFLRIVMTALVVGGIIIFARRSFALPKAAILPIFGVGFCVVFQGVAYLSSVNYIPVGLAVLLFYTFPLMVALSSWIIDKQEVDRARLIAFLFAFGGIGLAVGPSFNVLDWRGIALALVGAVGVAFTFIFTAQSLKHVGSTAVSFYSNVFAIPMMAITMMMMGGYQPPATDVGILGLLGVCIFYSLAVAMQYAAIHSIGKAFTALLSNIEPVVSIAAGALLLGEVLSGLQYMGGLIVVTSLVVSDMIARRSRKVSKP